MPPSRRHALARPITLLCTCLALTSALTPAPPARAVAPPVYAERYGINVGGDTLRQAPAVRDAALAALVRGGVRVARLDLAWNEPAAPAADGRHTYSWTSYDKAVGLIAAAGLRLYPVVAYSAPWASVVLGNPMSRPRDPAQFAAFAAAVVGRYGPGGAFWTAHPELPPLPATTVEIWNEENSSHFWLEQATAAGDYANLFMASRTAIRLQAPTVRVVVGGLVDAQAPQFLAAMFNARRDLATAIDAVGYHPYLLTPAQVVGRITALRNVLDSRGARSATIELTEVGWSLLEMSEARRGENLATLTQLVANPALRVSRVIPYSAMTSEADPSRWDQWFGLLNRNGTPKPSFTRWTAQIAALRRR